MVKGPSYDYLRISKLCWKHFPIRHKQLEEYAKTKQNKKEKEKERTKEKGNKKPWTSGVARNIYFYFFIGVVP